jgi:hypothetical protein
MATETVVTVQPFAAIATGSGVGLQWGRGWLTPSAFLVVFLVVRTFSGWLAVSHFVAFPSSHD